MSLRLVIYDLHTLDIVCIEYLTEEAWGLHLSNDDGDVVVLAPKQISDYAFLAYSSNFIMRFSLTNLGQITEIIKSPILNTVGVITTLHFREGNSFIFVVTTYKIIKINLTSTSLLVDTECCSSIADKFVASTYNPVTGT